MVKLFSGIREIGETAALVNAIPAHLGIPGHKPPAEFFSFSGKLEYTPIAGLKELREKIAEVYGRIYGRELPVESIFVTNGAMHGLFVALAALKAPVIFPEPFFPPYLKIADLLGLKVDFYSLTGDILASILNKVDEVAGKTGSKPAVVINFPHNPTGTCLRRKELEELVDSLEGRAFIINDAIYTKMCFFKEELPVIGDVVIDSFSKLFALPGLRIGFVVAPKELRQRIKDGIRATVSCLSKLSQLFALNVLNNFEDSYIEYVKRFYAEKRELVLKHLRSFLVRHPEGAFYAWLHFPGISSDELLDKLLRRKPKPVAFVPGRLFFSSSGSREEFRVAYGHLTEEEIKEIAKALEEVTA